MTDWGQCREVNRHGGGSTTPDRPGTEGEGA
jgi:hypothetical protein